MSEFVNWSYSSINILRQCNRKYYFNNILASHGRKNPLRRKAYDLKKMQNLAMWKGSVVDKFLEKRIIPAISKKETLDFELLANQAVLLARSQFDFSKYKLYKDPTISKEDAQDDFCILDIHEVGKPYSETELAEAYATIHQAILDIPVLKMPDGKLLINFLKDCTSLVPNIASWMVYVEKAMVKPQMDLLAFDNFKPVVIDWKLSESYTADYSRQLLICGITVYLKRVENPDKPQYKYNDIRLYEVNLLKGVIKEHAFTEKKINDLIDYINLTSKDLLLLKNNLTGDINDIEDFELTDNEGHCKFCNHRSLCAFLLQNNNEYDEKSYTELVQSGQFA